MTARRRPANVRPLPLPRFGLGPQLVAVLLAVAVFGSMAVQPTRQLLEQRTRMAGLTAELAELQATNRALARRIARLKDPAYVERRARAEIGLVRPGERAFVVMPPSRKRPGPRPAPPPAEPKQPGWLAGFVAFLGL